MQLKGNLRFTQIHSDSLRFTQISREITFFFWGGLGNSRGTNREIEFWGNQSQRGIPTTTHDGGNQGAGDRGNQRGRVT